MSNNIKSNPEYSSFDTQMTTGAEENAEFVFSDPETPEPKETFFRMLKNHRGKRLKNQFLVRYGSYSLAITAIVLAVLILFNWLILSLSDRFNLQFDLSPEHVNTIDAQNLEYIKKINLPITVTVCAGEDNYADYMAYYGENLYNASGDRADDYYSQTVKLINRYHDYNDRITVDFIDPQSTAFTAVSQKYGDMNLSYGDIIVSAVHKTGNGENERRKKIGFKDIYDLTDENGYAAYGYGSYTVSGNKIETALTGAIAYAMNTETKNALILTGHSATDRTASFVQLLKDNNYEVNTNSNSIIASIPEETDLVVIAAPTVDFIGAELNVLSEYLDNNGKLGKGLLFFADVSCPAVPNFYDFLMEWGIQAKEGILFETNEQSRAPDDPCTMALFPAETEASADLSFCITGNNVPFVSTEATEGAVTVNALIQTDEAAAIAPVGVRATWNQYTEKDLGQYFSVVQSDKEDFDSDNNPIYSHVIAFSSADYIDSQWTEEDTANKEISMIAADLAAGVENSDISFVTKTITKESFAGKVTESKTNLIKWVFMILLPVAMLAIGVIIYIRRRNA